MVSTKLYWQGKVVGQLAITTDVGEGGAVPNNVSKCRYQKNFEAHGFFTKSQLLDDRRLIS